MKAKFVEVSSDDLTILLIDENISENVYRFIILELPNLTNVETDKAF